MTDKGKIKSFSEKPHRYLLSWFLCQTWILFWG